MLAYGIPEYRLPRQVLEKEIKYLESQGVEIKTSTPVESLDKLFEQGYQAVLVAAGTHRGQKLRIPGADHKDTLVSLDFLRAVNSGEKVEIGRKVLVLGGGNVGFDCARVARRLGAETVQIACLESRENMLASDDEIAQALEEGIRIYPSRTFTKVLTENGKIIGVECLEVESFSFDEERNLQVETREGSYHVLEADTVIFAIGQRPEIPAGFGLNLAGNHLIEMDPYTLTTSRDGVFAAGDAVSGTSSVIKAIASGRKSAVAIDRFLEGSGNIDEKLAPQSSVNNNLGKEDGFAKLARCHDNCLAPEKRQGNFCPVAEEMDEKQALEEAHRCLQCDLRLKITSVKFWGSY
jgi:NADPH-dependent glutamate synthase beta subunit-like oxidoreductase